MTGITWKGAKDGRMETAEGLSISERAALNGLGLPSHGACLRCGDRWNWKQWHDTPQRGSRMGAFPLCEECWRYLATPAARFPFYEALVCQWAAQGAPEPAAIEGLWQGLHDEVGLPAPPMPCYPPKPSPSPPAVVQASQLYCPGCSRRGVLVASLEGGGLVCLRCGVRYPHAPALWMAHDAKGKDTQACVAYQAKGGRDAKGG